MEKKNQKLTNEQLTIEQRHLIMSYPTYFQTVLTTCAQNGESIVEAARELEKDWACFT